MTRNSPAGVLHDYFGRTDHRVSPGSALDRPLAGHCPGGARGLQADLTGLTPRLASLSEPPDDMVVSWQVGWVSGSPRSVGGRGVRARRARPHPGSAGRLGLRHTTTARRTSSPISNASRRSSTVSPSRSTSVIVCGSFGFDGDLPQVAGEPEPWLVGRRHRCAPVGADVEGVVGREDDRDGLVDAALGQLLVVDRQRPGAALTRPPPS